MHSHSEQDATRARFFSHFGKRKKTKKKRNASLPKEMKSASPGGEDGDSASVVMEENGENIHLVPAIEENVRSLWPEDGEPWEHSLPGPSKEVEPQPSTQAETQRRDDPHKKEED